MVLNKHVRLADMLKITLVGGEVLFRQGLPASSADCCRGCCCKDGFIDRSFAFKSACESAGGVWAACPAESNNPCSCECTPSAIVNQVVVAAGDPADPEFTGTFLGGEEATTVLGGLGVPEWKFFAVADSLCSAGLPPYVLRVTLYVQLWLNGSNWSAAYGVFAYSAGIWEFLFNRQACFDESPNSWPCVEATAAVLNGGPDGPDAGAVAGFFGNFGINFGDPASAGWDAEYEAAAAAYFEQPTGVRLDCTWSPPCE